MSMHYSYPAVLRLLKSHVAFRKLTWKGHIYLKIKLVILRNDVRVPWAMYDWESNGRCKCWEKALGVEWSGESSWSKQAI